MVRSTQKDERGAEDSDAELDDDAVELLAQGRIAALTELVEAQARCDCRECEPWASSRFVSPMSSSNATRQA
jgi:hypothetical protein